MDETSIRRKIIRTKKVLYCFEWLLPFAIIVPLILLKLDPFCAGVKGDHMGCGIGGLIVCCGIALLAFLTSSIGMIVCSVIIKKQKELLAKVTQFHYEPLRFNVVLMITLMILFVALFIAILMPLFSSTFETENWWIVLVFVLSGVLGISLSVTITYFLRA